MANQKYATLYERLVANTRLAEEDNPRSCWLWTGAVRGHYGSLAVRRGATVAERAVPRQVAAHRAMLEEVLDATFPLDEGGHLCRVQLCANPDHLEVQTKIANLAARRGYAAPEGSWIPVLFPRRDPLQEWADWAWDTPGELATVCPF